jgi:hypothetical protein
VEQVEAALEGVDEVRRRGVAGKQAEPAFVVGEGVGHDEGAPALDLDMVGKVVVVGVAVVEEAALLDEEPARVHARAVAAVPALAAHAGGPADRFARHADVVGLLAREAPHLLPAPAVAAGLVVRFAQPGGELGVALERDGAGVEGEGQAALGQQPLEPPDAGAAAVLDHALDGEVADGGVQRVDGLLQPPFRRSPAGWEYAEPSS